MPTPIYVIIPTSGRADLMRRTLASLSDCDRPANFAGVIVIENGGGRDSEAAVRDLSLLMPITYLWQAEPGKSRALNRALRHIASIDPDALAVFADNDVRFAPTWLTSYSATHDQFPDDFLGGPVVADYVSPPPQWLVRHLPYSARGWTWDGPDDVVDRPHFLGFNFAARTRDLLAIDGFPEHLGPGASTGISVGDEFQVQTRLLAAGRKGRFLPAAVTYHHVPAERCNPDWALKRTYVMGLCAGAQTPPYKGWTVGGVPSWMVARWVKGVARSVVVSVLPTPREYRFFAKKRRQFNRGLMRGVRMQRDLPVETTPQLAGRL